MQIRLEEPELKQAIAQYIEHRGMDLSNLEIAINLTAGRGKNGHYADIELIDKKLEQENPFEDAPAAEADPDSEAINFDD